MNLSPPPDSCDQYSWDLYRFLQHPVFDQLRLNPRSLQGTTDEGTIYFDSDDGLQIAGSGGTFNGTTAPVTQRTPTSWDFDETDLNDTGSWEDLDFSSIIPSGSTFAQFSVRCNGAGGNKGAWCKFRTKEDSPSGQNRLFYHQETGYQYYDFQMALDEDNDDRIIQYYRSGTANWYICCTGYA